MKKWLRRASMVAAFSMALGGGTVASQMSPSPAEASLSAFNCVISVAHPHASHHVSGTINVEGRVDCGQRMESIYIRLYLHKQGGGDWAGTPNSMNNASYLKANAATSCSAGSGQYWGEARVTAVPPAGWSPRSASGSANGFVLPLACGDPLTSGDDPDGVGSNVVLGTIRFEPSEVE
ncbi:hypothetical protein N1027_17965 [Herbiconiux sp. CPCC 205763]|uniref:Secreted protein n=1 Tax=Herbiconiux aconitum TaxID=2970913 RepID=A0ABT2GV59_9MICO|nr:hypothetical protein [Herbiconiux aconitum]MCS5720021.1 hypothetical protein [Herbiconiux aconitum]